MTDLAGRTVLVTGAAVRLGAAIARHLAGLGAAVVVHFHTRHAEADALVRALTEGGSEAWTVQADLSGPDAAEGLVATAADAAGRPIDGVVLNASAYPPTTWDTVTWDDVDAAMRIHAWASLAILRAAAAQGNGGAAVAMLDTRLVDLDAGHLAYHVSKAAMASVTDAAARLLAPRWRVNAVAPGPVLEPVGSKDAGYLDRLARLMPLRRAPTPGDVAVTVAHLLAVPSITGQTVHVDAGRHLGRPIEDP